MFFHTLIICLAVPRKRLCIGSMGVILIGSTYGNLMRHEYLVPNLRSRQSLSPLDEQCKIWETLSLCDEFVLYSKAERSNPHRFFHQSFLETLFLHLLHPIVAECPKKPQSFLLAGTSHPTHNKVSLKHFTVFFDLKDFM